MWRAVELQCIGRYETLAREGYCAMNNWLFVFVVNCLLAQVGHRCHFLTPTMFHISSLCPYIGWNWNLRRVPIGIEVDAYCDYVSPH